MKYLVTLLLFSISYNSFNQNLNECLFILKDDGSPFSREIKHMWIGQKNGIAFSCRRDENVDTLWTDNGTISKCSDCLAAYFIEPKKVGPINVFSVRKNGLGNSDTILVHNKFKAIEMPDIYIKVEEDNFKKDSTIRFMLVDHRTMRKVKKRYVVGRMFEPKIYNELDSLIGKVNYCFDTTIDFNNPINRNRRLSIKSGYKIGIQVLVRDRKTDLLIPTNSLIYTIE